MAIILAEPNDTIDAMGLEQLRGPASASVLPTEPKLTAQVVTAVVSDLIEVEANGGYLGIARARGIWRVQVAAIDRARMTRIGELTAVAEPEPVDIEPKIVKG